MRRHVGSQLRTTEIRLKKGEDEKEVGEGEIRRCLSHRRAEADSGSPVLKEYQNAPLQSLHSDHSTYHGFYSLTFLPDVSHVCSPSLDVRVEITIGVS